MKIAVVFGGISPERNVSLTGGKAVIDALKSLGHEVVAVDPAFGKDAVVSDEILADMGKMPTLDELEKYPPKNLIDCVNSEIFDDIDVAFIVLHGKYGEDGKFQALLELRGIPYTGSDIKASSTAIDKAASKLLFLASGIPTPQWTVLTPDEYEDFDLIKNIRDEFGEVLVVKPNDQGSTVGITIIEDGNIDDIIDAVKLAGQFSNKVLIEEFIEGSEITVSIVGSRALPIIEIVPESGFYDYEHKYTKGHTEYICPADLSDDITDFTQNLALTAYNVIGCEGFARADFRLNDEGQAYLLEINTIPGFTATSLVPMAAQETGIEFPELCQELIDLALDKQ